MAFYGLGIVLLGALIFIKMKERVEKSMLLRYAATFLVIFGSSIIILTFMNP